MAYTEQETIVANPARKGRMTLKQKLHFGSKRQRAAAKKALSRKRKKSHAKANRARHRKRSVPRAKAKHRVNASHRRRATANRAKPKRKTSHRVRSKKRSSRGRRNPGEIISIYGAAAGNPARKGRKKMAATKRKRRHTSSNRARRNAGTRHHKPKRSHNRGHRRRNPGMTGIVAEALATGVGLFGSQFIAQMVLGSNNTGIMGYAANGIAGGLLAGAASMVRATQRLAPYVIVGTVLEILYRIIVDNSLLGQYTSQLGMGDYMASNWVTPQRLPDALHNAQIQIPSGWGGGMIAAPSAAGAPGVTSSAAAPKGSSGMGWLGGEQSYY